MTVFEAFSQPGGMLRYGIPRYRLPREVLDAEIQRILDLGVELKCNFTIGKDMPLEQLRQEYQAVFVGIGAHKGLKLRVPGEDAPNVFTGTEFLNKANSGEEVQIGGKVLVIGGGDTAIDAARVSRRLGAEVTLLYRRTRAEMPAIKPEIEGALEEGVHIEFLAAPVEILRKNGTAVGARCIRMELGAAGRFRTAPARAQARFGIRRGGDERSLPPSARNRSSMGLSACASGQDWIKTDEWGTTSAEGVFAGGDDVELGLVTIAISQGRFAAEAIDARLRGKQLEKPVAAAARSSGAGETRLVQGVSAPRARAPCRRAAHHGG